MMASAASIASTINTSSSPVSASTGSQRDGSNRSVKSNTAARMTQKGRKESPSDSNRQSASPKAWSGSNPITQRASTPNQGKGSYAHNKSTTSAKMAPSKDGLSDKHNYDRLRFLFGGSVGLSVVLVTKAGDKYEGLFAGYASSANAPKITLKMTKKVPANPITQPNGVTSWEAAFAGSSPDYAMTFDLKDMADMTIPEFSLPELPRQTNGAAVPFQTDTDISGNVDRSERTLQPWVPDAADTNDFSLESGSATDWDQFATHAKMTGGHSTYAEEIYTTTIDRTAPDFRRREAQAAKIAREIESQSSTNAHIREERGQALENDVGDEEDKYSGVRRRQQDSLPLASEGANRYTPPALRAPTGKPSAAGAPFDPAIISSHMSRPDMPHSTGSQQPLQAKIELSASDKAASQAQIMSALQGKSDDDSVASKPADLSKVAANASVARATQPKQMVSVSPERSAEGGPASQGVEQKLLHSFKGFAETERQRLAEKKRQQASQDRTAKINDLVRFAKNFKLKTPIPDDLVGILAKDPKKQAAITERAQRDHDESKTSAPSTPVTASSASIPQLPLIARFDKSQIPPPIPERNTFNATRGSYAKSSLGRGPQPRAPLAFPVSTAQQSAPRGPSARNGHFPTPIPMPDVKNHQITAASSGMSSPRGVDTPTSAVSTKFNVGASVFRPNAAAFNPSSASASAASPSPIKRTASVARTASPSVFFGARKPRSPSQRLDVTKSFDPLKRMQDEVKAKLAQESEPKRDYAGNGGIPNAFHTGPRWEVSKVNEEKTYEEFFNRGALTASPAQSRTSSHNTVPFHGQMQHMTGPPHIQQAVTPQHGHHPGPHYQSHFDDQRMHMQNGSPSMYASPNMTPRGAYASPMGHPAQTAYGHQSYFGGVQGPIPMRPYGNNAAMMHGQHGHMGVPMVQQQSSGPYMGISNQMMVYPSPRAAHVYPQQQNGYPSPGPMAPAMMHQGSQQGYHNPSMMYPASHHMYGQQQQMGRGYGGNTPYGTSPHQPHHMGQRAMSSGFVKGVPQMHATGGAPVNAPSQPAAFSHVSVAEETK